MLLNNCWPVLVATLSNGSNAEQFCISDQVQLENVMQVDGVTELRSIYQKRWVEHFDDLVRIWIIHLHGIKIFVVVSIVIQKSMVKSTTEVVTGLQNQQSFSLGLVAKLMG